MISLKTISTGSVGNMYILDCNGRKLIIELGMAYRDLLLNIDDIREIDGAICTHKHSDHWQEKIEKQLFGLGIETLLPENTQIGKRYKLGDFDIIPLPAKHDVTCQSYLIKANGTNILFATDTQVLPIVKNIKIDYFIVEVNFIEQIREQAVLQCDDAHLGKVYQTHHSLENAVEYFERLSYKAKKIVTIHKSSSGLFSKEETIKRLSQFAEDVFVAENGSYYELQEN